MVIKMTLLKIIFFVFFFTFISSKSYSQIDVEARYVIIQDHLDEIKRDGMHSIRSLMGLAMKQVRGQASGNLVNNLLSEKIKKL